jgi:regulator of RNase E activity RraA
MDVADVVRPDPGLVAALGRLATGTLANALDAVGATNSILPTIKSVAPGMRCAGTAVTIRETVGPVGTYESKDFAVGALIDAAEAGDIIVVEGGGLPISTWGGMATCAAVEKGIAGLVVDGGVRDLEEIIEFGLPVFARHLAPTTGRTRLKVEAINYAITVDGIHIEPGDVIVADGTGVVVVPIGHIDEVLALAEAFDRDDGQAVEDLKNGLSFSEAMAKFGNI